MDLKKLILMILKRESKAIAVQHLFKLVKEESGFRYDEYDVRVAIWPLIVQDRIKLTAERKLQFSRMY